MIQDIYRKNRDDLRALFLWEYPPFFYRGSKAIAQGEIPVFVFHSVLPDRFEAQMAYLAANGYRTVDANELHDILLAKKPLRANTVALTIDDGRGCLFATAWPILKKYGFHAIAFIVPGKILESEDINPTLDDLWKRRIESSIILNRDSTIPFLTWNEIRVMHRSGIIDFQSHSMFHNSIYISGRIVEFGSPSFQASSLHGLFFPVVRQGDRDMIPNRLDWGAPVYEWGPALGSEKRYMEDENLERFLTNYVQDNGGAAFFDRPGWRRSLRGLALDFEKRNGTRARFQTREERYADMYNDFLQSKRLIEEKIGNRVTHFCYPWFLGCELAVRASREAGYESNYWGLLKRRALSRIGDDPYHVARLIEDYIFLLPGKNRRNLCRVLADRCRRIAARGKRQNPLAGGLN